MWNLFNCYLSGRHEYGVWCEPGNIFLRCVHCGKRSNGWSLTGTPQITAPQPRAMTTTTATQKKSRVVPFDRAVAR